MTSSTLPKVCHNFLDRRPKVTLIRPRESSGVTEFSLGMGYVARALLNSDIDVSTICRDLVGYSDSQMLELIKDSEADVFALGGMYGSFLDFIHVCRLIKGCRPHVPIILGGALPTSEPEHALAKTGADFVCVGPADESIVALVRAILDGSDISAVAGICFRDGSGFHRTAPANQPRFLSAGSSTWPAWELFDGHSYTRGTMYYPFSPDDIAAPILTARGCPYSCNFCFQPMNYARRSLDDVYDEMQWLIESYGVTAFYLEDDLFMLDRKRVLAFCDGLHERDIRTKFTATGRFNIVDRDLLVALKEAGCVTLFYGGESAQDETLNLMKKKTTVDQMRNGITLTREVGIFTRTGFMFGQPGETEDSLRATVSFLKEIAYGCYEPRLIYGCVPFPATDLFKFCQGKGLLNDEEDFFNKFRFQERLLDQMPVNMTAVRDKDPMVLLTQANQELLQFYRSTSPGWMRVISSEAA